MFILHSHPSVPVHPESPSDVADSTSSDAGPGRTYQGIKVGPHFLVTTMPPSDFNSSVLQSSCHQRRPGYVFGYGSGVNRVPSSGKYLRSLGTFPLPDVPMAFSDYNTADFESEQTNGYLTASVGHDHLAEWAGANGQFTSDDVPASRECQCPGSFYVDSTQPPGDSGGQLAPLPVTYLCFKCIQKNHEISVLHSPSSTQSHLSNSEPSSHAYGDNDDLAVTIPSPVIDTPRVHQPEQPIEDVRSGLQPVAFQQIRFYYQNVRSLNNKVDEFFLTCMDCEYDVIMLTETWLDGSVKPIQLFGDAFTVYTMNRNPANSRRKKGGGVLIAVRKTLDSVECVEAAAANLEQIFVTIHLENQKVFVGCFYLPSEKRHENLLLEQHMNCIETVRSIAVPHDTIVVVGDYNQSHLVWKPLPGNRAIVDPVLTHTSCAAERTTHETLLDGIARNNMHQRNLVCNHQNRILDLVLINDGTVHTIPTAALESLVSLDNYHPALTFEVSAALNNNYEDSFDPLGLNFRKTDFVSLQRSLEVADWSSVLASTDVDEAVALFGQILRSHLVHHTPEFLPLRKPAWSNARLRKLKSSRASALTRYSQRRCPETKAAFNAASSRYKVYNRYRYADYIRKTQANLRRNPSQFWKFVKTKYKENGLPAVMTLGGTVASTNSEKCVLFARHFASVFRTPASPPASQEHLETVPSDLVDLDVFQITEDMLKRGTQKLKSSNAPGPDGIPPVVVKRCLNQISAPLLRIFNLSMSQYKFPEEWKRSVMFPVFKKGSKRSIENYRGITSLCTGSKLLEIVVGEVIMFNCRSVISSVQHGFTPGRSVSTNLMEFTNFCIENMAAGRQVDAVYTDLKAAFDRIDHDIALQKFAKLGFSSRLCCWLESYLKNRIIQVKIGSELSDEFTNGSGVAQGSNLGPIVFVGFFNDSNALFNDYCKLSYADDFKIFLAIDSLADCYGLQSRLDKFANWCTVNRMELSVTKCTTISFHRKTRREVFTFDYTLGGHVLERLTVVKDLGVLLDEKLSFRQQQAAIVDKANRQLGFLFRMAREFDDPLCLRSLYNALVRSHLETSAVIWSPYHHNWIDRIERIQKKFVWFACRRMPWTDPTRLPRYEARCNLIGLETLENRRTIAKAIFAAKILTSQIDSPNLLNLLNAQISSRNLRPRTNFLARSLARTDFHSNSPVRAISAAFNEVYFLFEFHEPIQRFREKLRIEFQERTRTTLGAPTAVGRLRSRRQ